MSDEGFQDPAPPPDATERLKGTTMVGQNCLILWSGEEGEWPAKEATPATETEKAQKAKPPQRYLECSVWTLDRAGVVAHADDVRISWWRVVPDLEQNRHKYLCARPTKDTDNSIILAKVTDGDVRAAAARLVEELIAGKVTDSLGGEVEPGTEPFTDDEVM